MTAFRPDGHTLLERCAEVKRRRERWIAENPDKHCVVIIHASQTYLGQWLTNEGIAWMAMPVGKQGLKDEVRFAEAEEVGA